MEGLRKMTLLRVMSGLRILIVSLIAGLLAPMWALGQDASGDQFYKQYTDPARRFIFDYPATMTVKTPSANEAQVYHPSAPFRISVYVEKLKGKKPLKAEDLIEALKKTLKAEKQDVTVLGEGKLPELQGSQAFIIVSFREGKGPLVVQLAQYYCAPKASLQMVISDRASGFKNLEPVIRKVHHSLRIIDPELK